MAPSRQRKVASQGNPRDDGPSKIQASDLHKHYAYLIILVILAGTISISHRTFLSTLFENDRHFSHLSSLERELSFRTEMGLYFSYFKTIIDAETFFNGVYQIMRDNITEYPSTINTLKRFNLYPEVILGLGYRIFQTTSDFFGHHTKTCWTVNRGDNLSPVQSCEGLGEPSYFYIEAVFLLNGFMMGTFFLFGTYLSGSIFGGLITVICFLFNHGEATRVMWTPPLRESFGYPLFVLQMFVVTYVLRSRKSTMEYSLLIAWSQVCFMLSWQFAQFALLTQTLAVLTLYVLQFISADIYKAFLRGQTIGLVLSYLLLFGNEMLLTSFFSCSIIAAWGLLFFEQFYKGLKYRFLVLLSQGITFIMVTLSSKFVIGKLFQLEDDAHIADIFKSKFTNFQNFHTMLYTCAKEFDFIETETIWKLSMTLLLPSALVAQIVVAFHILRAEIKGTNVVLNNKDTKAEASLAYSRHISKYDAELLYHSLQLIAFTAVAILVMRLKLFWTPHLCLFSSLLASRKVFPWLKKENHIAVLAALVACMALYGISNVKVQLGRVGEFSNIPQEELVEWINSKTDKDAVFAGAMPTMATVKLCTHRPIVNHPHYEDAGLRERTKLVYSIYSRKPLVEVKSNLDKLGVQYVILEDSWCSQRLRDGCSMPEIWDIEDVANHGKQAACLRLKKNTDSSLFKLVFKNSVYYVFRLINS
ncbi:probable C-mannosyltransferase DPY19L1 [Physella acuta]|uniref:probable C-mannosyltransferase DPY19L1 n=1 Tax=Physella acuta TaxID=109671 RepID=UPI0027DDF2DC|nr:probable C-mannosyltransferase DPY19L1 [Physella acuta]